MIHIIPVECISYQEVLHLGLSVIKNLRSPVRMLSETRIRVLVACFAVEIGKAMGIFWKMCRHPVQNHTDSGIVQDIHHFHKVLRTAVARSRCKVARNLIAPGAVKGVLRNTHELHMGVAHIVAVFRKISPRLLIADEAVSFGISLALPRADMHFIDSHGTFFPVCLFPALHPFLIGPREFFYICRNGSISGTELTGKGIGVCLINPLVLLCQNSILIELIFSHLRNKALKNTGVRHINHGISFRIPAISVTDQGYRLRMGCPDREVNSLLSFISTGMCSHFLINLIMSSYSEKIAIQFRKKSVHNPPPMR